MAVSWVLKPQHRSRVMFQRFMPWWNREKRRELAEKKERQEKQKQEEEEKRIEEEKRQDEDKRKEEGEKTQAELENTEKEDIKDATKFDESETKMSDDNISKTAIKATGIVNEKKNDERDIERNNSKMFNNDDNFKIVKINKNPNTKTGADSKLKQPKGVSVKKRSDSVTDRRTGKLK
ncbi:Protein phosphatase 1, regulatory subunit 15A [Operophtera brumata]|uniref:Protein phosphatase 1, regulatory subunit 15A n=1 Tax=Operophtera brumata TaxID=104452 RepID=A0A0L7L8J4_OPEBR|nr:Protein phosphatase 1, regulatory subunit 15A [Operophtera brumata]